MLNSRALLISGSGNPLSRGAIVSANFWVTKLRSSGNGVVSGSELNFDDGDNDDEDASTVLFSGSIFWVVTAMLKKFVIFDIWYILRFLGRKQFCYRKFLQHLKLQWYNVIFNLERKKVKN